MTQLARDVVYAGRLFAHYRLALVTAVLCLGFSFGLCAALIAVANAWFFPRLGVHSPSSLWWVAVTEHGSKSGFQNTITFADFESWRTAVRAGSVAAYLPARGTFSTIDTTVGNEVSLAFVSDEFFDVLGGRPRIGHLLGSTKEPSSDCAVISHDVWVRVFGGSADVIDAMIKVRGVPYVIVGVTDANFIGASSQDRPAVWLPIRSLQRESGGRMPAVFPQVLARLRTDTEKAEFRTQLTTALGQPNVEGDGKRSVDFRSVVSPLLSGRAASAMPVVWGLIGALLLVAVINLAGFLVGTAVGRQREIAVRLAVGATRPILMRQLMTESLVVGAAGVLCGWGAMHLFVPVLDWMIDIPLGISLRVDWRTYGFLAAVGLSASLLAGFAPLHYTSKFKLADHLKGVRSIWSFGGIGRIRSLLLCVQIGLSVVTVLLAIFWTLGAQRARNADVGFDADRLLLLRGRAVGGDWTSATAEGYWREALARVGQARGVESAALVRDVFGGGFERKRISVPSGRELTVAENRTSGSYFSAMGIKVVAGRVYSESEIGSNAPVAVISAKTARDLWGSPLAALGASFMQSSRSSSEKVIVIGVAQDSVTTSLLELSSPLGSVFRPLAPEFSADASMVIRVSGEPSELENQLEQLLPVAVPTRRPRLSLLAAAVERQTKLSQVPSRIALFGGSAIIVLTIVGLHGVLSLAVHQRTAEIAVRMALGAPVGAIARLALATAATPMATGLIAGTLCAYGLVRVAPALLFGVSQFDGIALASSLLLLVTAGAVGIAAPIIAALRVQPFVVLKNSN